MEKSISASRKGDFDLMDFMLDLFNYPIGRPLQPFITRLMLR